MNISDFQGIAAGLGTEAEQDRRAACSLAGEDHPSTDTSDQELIEKEGFVDSKMTEDPLTYLAETPGPFEIEVEQGSVSSDDSLADTVAGQPDIDQVDVTSDVPANMDMSQALGSDVKNEIKNEFGTDVSNIEVNKSSVSFDVGGLNVDIKASSDMSIAEIRSAFDRLIRRFANRYRISAHRPADIFRRFSNDGDREAEAQAEDRNNEIDRIRAQGGRYGELNDAFEIVVQRRTIDSDMMKQIDIDEHVRHKKINQDI